MKAHFEEIVFNPVMMRHCHNDETVYSEFVFFSYVECVSLCDSVLDAESLVQNKIHNNKLLTFVSKTNIYQ